MGGRCETAPSIELPRRAGYGDRVIGRPLNDQELRSYRHVPDDVARRVRVVAIPALPGRYVGLTLGSIVFLAEEVSDDGDSTLLAHELVHVRQWHEQGRARFAVAYLRAFGAGLIRHRSWQEAYRAIPAEVEARQEAGRWLRSHQGRPAADDGEAG